MRKAVGILALVAFAGGALLSLALVGTAVHDNMAMPGCPLMPDEAVICTMTVSDHIAAWQNMFTGIPQAASILFAVFLAAYMLRSPYLVFARQPSGRIQRFARESGSLPSPLEELFSRGVLNPKLY